MARPVTPLLDRVSIPSDLRNYSADQLKRLADELRAETIDAVSVTGGHLGASLGVVELTVAIHAIFDTPHDRLIWDVGIVFARSARAAGFPASPSGVRVNTTPSARRILPPASPPALAWRLAANCRAANGTSFP